MNKIFAILLTAILIFSCSSSSYHIEKVAERYTDGEPKVVEYYKKIGNDQELSHVKSYYENGNKRFELECHSDVCTMKNLWDRDGQLIVVNGNGYAMLFNENGNIQYESNYINGHPDGLEKEYREDGNLISESYYENGKDLYNKHYEEDGSLRTENEIFYENGEISHMKHYQDGSLIAEDFYENGKKSHEKSYYGGSLMSENFYENGVIVIFKWYYEDGSLKMENFYENGKKSHQKSYYGGGTLRSETFYENGEQSMKKFYNKDGSIKESN